MAGVAPAGAAGTGEDIKPGAFEDRGEPSRWREYNIEPTSSGAAARQRRGFARRRCAGSRPAEAAALLILALDTTTRAGSVAVVRDGELVCEIAGDPARTHGQRLPGDLTRALDGARVRVADVELLAVAAGPGSFTGLRVGIATVQGLAMARGLSVVPVSTLEALARHAAAGAGPGAHIAAWMDAQRGEVFAALYRPGLSATIFEPSSASPAGTLADWQEQTAAVTIRFIGDGAVRYRSEIAARFGDRAEIVEPTPLLAGPIALIAHERPERAVQPHALVPAYVRRPDAELARARQAARTSTGGA